MQGAFFLWPVKPSAPRKFAVTCQATLRCWPLMSFLEAVLWSVMNQFPLLAALFAGTVLAFHHVRERPELRWAIAAFVLLGVTGVLDAGVSTWLPLLGGEQEMTSRVTTQLMTQVGVFLTVLETVGWGCLLAG
ncbi:hypothetical protein CTI14_33610, partial [Methylobacterium radiotolerans]